MPFIRRNFSPLGGQSTRGSGPEAQPGAPQMWSFRTQDAHTVVDTSGYFNEVFDLLEIGDIIWVVVVSGAGALQSYGSHAVITKTAATRVIDVTNVTTGVVTNTD